MVQTVLLVLLVIYALAAFVGAVFYMRYRRLTLVEFAIWGILAFFVPVFGPFFVIAARPGPRKRLRRPRQSIGFPAPSERK